MDAGIRERQLRGRVDPPAGDKRNARKKVLIGGVAAIFVAFGIAGQSVWPWHSPTISIGSDPRDEARGPVTIEAEQLRKAYQDDWKAAARRFGNREMVVSGEFLRIVPDGYGSLDLRLKTSIPEAPLGVDVAQLAIEDAKQLRPGQRVTVSCQHMGSGGDQLWLQDCAIQQTGGVAQPPPAPPAPPPPSEQQR
jgi:hypothetical protein